MAISSAPGTNVVSGSRAPVARPVRRRAANAWRSQRAAKADAAAVRDPFLDVVVLLSVLMFLALAAGIGILILEPTLHWPN
ncbi:MAG: hypothetical protein QOE89_266 [Pseudonocardiales bacterium]|nr:hypothetical protein [Pseudonocardiales bacterium]